MRTRSRITSVAAAFALALTGALTVLPGTIMAQTTTTILVSGTYNGMHVGGPFNVPHGTSQIEIGTNVTDAAPGANFTMEADISSDGGVTWQQGFFLSCPGGTVVTRHGTGPTQDASCSDQSGINLDPAKTYIARYTEHSDVPIQANATITIF